MDAGLIERVPGQMSNTYRARGTGRAIWPNVDVHAWAERHDGESAEGWLFLVLNGDVSIEEMRAAICEDREPTRKS